MEGPAKGSSSAVHCQQGRLPNGAVTDQAERNPSPGPKVFWQKYQRQQASLDNFDGNHVRGTRLVQRQACGDGDKIAAFDEAELD